MALQLFCILQIWLVVKFSDLKDNPFLFHRHVGVVGEILTCISH
jgi:hypothetical protein